MIRILFIICVLSSKSFAIFGLEKIQADLSLLKMNVADKALQNADALAKINAKIDKLEIKLDAQAQAQASAIAGVNNRINHTQTNTSAGRDNTQTNTNDTVMINRLIDSYKDSMYQQGIVYKAIIIMLIGQLCFLLRMFIKKDSTMEVSLLKIISDDAEREDMSNNLNGKSIVNAQVKQELDKIESDTEHEVNSK